MFDPSFVKLDLRLHSLDTGATSTQGHCRVLRRDSKGERISYLLNTHITTTSSTAQRMVHPTFKYKPETTGLVGIPNINDCDGSIGKAEWDRIVRQEAAAAVQAEAVRQEEIRRRKQAQAHALEEQMESKKARSEQVKQRLRDEEAAQLRGDMEAYQQEQFNSSQFRNSYRGYLQRCHEVSVASLGLTTTATDAAKTKLQKGDNVMEFVSKSEQLRRSLDANSKREEANRRKVHDERERSISPRDLLSERWKQQYEAYAREVELMDRQAAKRSQEQARVHDLIERRAARAAAVAQHSSPREHLTSSSLTSSSPRHHVAPPAQFSRRELQQSIRQDLDRQLADKQLQRQADNTALIQTERNAIRQLQLTLEAEVRADRAEKERRQVEYRRALEQQMSSTQSLFSARGGFLPELAVNPYRRERHTQPEMHA